MTDDYSSPTRRIVIYAAVGVALMLGMAYLAQRQLAPARAAAESAGPAPAPEPSGPVLSDAEREEVKRGWMRSTTLAPRSERVDPATGEVTLPFQGFGLSVESTPEGAHVFVDGRDAGETPLLASLGCQPGATVEVRVEHPGRRPERRSTRCRADTLVKLSLELRPSPPSR